GRSFWILDDITPLRQLRAQVAAADVYLFRPQLATRVRRNVNTDTPLPPEEPAGQNPPDGAIIDYYLKSDATTPVTIEILDRTNKLVRRFSSADPPEPIPVNEKDMNVPTYWVRPPQPVRATAGMQRFVWDLHYPTPPADRYDYPISANYRDTPPVPQGPLVVPGQYTVRLTVNGRSYTQPLNVRIDPRVKTPLVGLQQQFAFSMRAYEGMRQSREALEGVRKLRAQLKDLSTRSPQGALAAGLKALDQKAAALETTGGAGRGAAANSQQDLTRLNAAFGTLLDALQEADATPTTQAVAASDEYQRALVTLLQRWRDLKTKDVPALNEQLRAANLPPLGL